MIAPSPKPSSSQRARRKTASKGPLRRKPAQARSKKKVDAIVKACGRVLAKEGYEGATTSRIAAAAKVPVGTLYEYFPNREALFTAFLEFHAERVMASVEALAPQQQGKTPDEVLRALVGTSVHAVFEHHAVLRVAFTQLPGTSRIPALVQFEQRIEGITRAVSWIAPGQKGRKDLPLKLYVLSNAVYGFIIRLATNPLPAQTPEEITDELVKLIRSDAEI